MTCNCIWNSHGICIFDVSQPGKLVECKPEGCKDYEARTVPRDYADTARK